MTPDTPPTPPPPLPMRGDLRALLIITVMVLAVRGWVYAHTVVTSRDSLAFIRYALQLEEPPADPLHPERRLTRLEVLRGAPHPPGHALAIWAVSRPVRALDGGATTCAAMVRSAQLVGILAAALLTLPLYSMGKRLFGPGPAFWGTLLFQALPVWAATSSDGISDALCLLGMTTGLACGVRALQGPSAGRFAVAGLACGAAYLVRPEGLLPAVVIGPLLLGGLLVWRGRRRATLAHGLAFTMAALLVAGPYMLAIGRLTNKPTANILMERGQGRDAGPSYEERASSRAGGTPLFAAWWDGGRSGQARWLWALKSLVLEVGKTGHYLPALLGLVGVALTWRRVRSEAALGFLLLFGLVDAVVLIGLALGVGYLSDRHTLPLALLGCLWTAAALPLLAERLTPSPERARRLAGWAGAGLVLACLPWDLRPLHGGREGHRKAGEWLAGHMAADEVVWDPFSWAEFYSGRALRGEPLRDLDGHVAYAVVEPQAMAGHLRLPMIDIARILAGEGVAVYQWPEGVAVERAKVAVFRRVPPALK